MSTECETNALTTTPSRRFRKADRVKSQKISETTSVKQGSTDKRFECSMAYLEVSYPKMYDWNSLVMKPNFKKFQTGLNGTVFSAILRAQS